MSRIWLIAMLLAPLYLTAQKNDGIVFQQRLSWKELQGKALAMNKFIFVDCYASWCGPCKKMDQGVYPDGGVGNFMNNYYLCVKVQMDSTPHDDPETIRWYADAHNLMLQGNVRAFPTYLFFSPKGELVHSGVGAKDTATFIAMAKDALRPDDQYYTLIRRYKEGQMNEEELPKLLKTVEELGDYALAGRIAREYLKTMIYKRPDSAFVKADLYIMWRYADSSNGRGFKYFYDHPKRVDSIMGVNGMSMAMIDRVVNAEEINPSLEKGKISESGWRHIYIRIARKYNQEIADRVVFHSRLRYYNSLKDWKHFAFCFEQEIKKYPPKSGSRKFGGLIDDAWELNSNAWLLFLYCSQRKILSLSLEWVATSLKINPSDVQVYDTKANLLYKMGRKEQGIEEEEVAIFKAENGGNVPRDFIKVFQGTISKMKSDQPTW